MLNYTITPHPHSHQWHISLTYSHEKGSLHQLKLANWTAGSYMIRDFSRHIMRVQAACNGEPIAITQINKNTWQLPDQAGEYQIDYVVYANDLSCRASLLDNERGFLTARACFCINLIGAMKNAACNCAICLQHGKCKPRCQPCPPTNFAPKTTPN